jgi:putative membrane protein
MSAEGAARPGTSPPIRDEGAVGAARRKPRELYDAAPSGETGTPGDPPRRDAPFRGEFEQRASGPQGTGQAGLFGTDASVREQFCKRIADDPRLAGASVEVAVEDHVLTLAGDVDDPAARDLLLDHAHRLGIADVRDCLRVGTQGATGRGGHLPAILALGLAGLSAGGELRAGAIADPATPPIAQAVATPPPRAPEAPRDVTAPDRESIHGGVDPASAPLPQSADEQRPSGLHGADARAGLARAPAPAQAAADREFVRSATQSGRQEVADARDAMQRARRGDVRSAAKSLLDEHTEANQRLAALAARKGWSVPADSPSGPPPRPLSADEFDAAYLDSERRTHQQAIALYRAHAAAGGDEDLVRFSREMLATLQHHLGILDALRKPGGHAP